MAYKISGDVQNNTRLIVIDESDWSVEHTSEKSAGAYEVEVTNSNKLVVARDLTSSDAVAYGGVSPYSTIPTIPFTDGMNDNGNWNQTSTDNSGSVITHVFSDGKLKQACTYNARAEAKLKWLMDGNFDMNVDIELIQYPIVNAYAFVFQFVDSVDNNYFGRIRYRRWSGQAHVEVNTKAGSHLTDTITPPGTSMNFRMLRKSSNTFEFYCGETKIQERAVTSNPVEITLYASTYSGGGPPNQYECHWDNFQITSGTFGNEV
jgi:hypothetical protein